MGKRLIQQRRGRGSVFKSPGHRFKGAATLPNQKATTGLIADIIKCPGHSAPLAEIKCDNGQIILIQAPEGVRINDKISIGSGEVATGSILCLKDIPEGTSIFNIEQSPGDGGRYARAAGTSARIITKLKEKITVMLPSKKTKALSPNCRAAIGTIAGAGRTEKPLMKAGNRYRKRKAKNQLYPKVCGTSMNAVAHPFGGSSSHIKGRPLNAPRFAPPGRKVGKLRAKRTGKKR